MTVPLWALELAGAFWAEAGGAEPFPRRLRGALLRTGFPLAIEELPGLSAARVERRLAEMGCPMECGAGDRPLRACLAARAGAGVIFLDAGDDPTEQTFSLAHELAHFLRDCWQLRRRAAEALGPAVLEVLDGQRPARPGERLHAILRDLPIGRPVHLMARGPYLSPAVAAAERDADRLAWELLAPADEVFARLGTRASAEQAEALLVRNFGLPAVAAAECAEALFPQPEPAPLVFRLKKALAARRTSLPTGEEGEGGHRDEPHA